MIPGVLPVFLTCTVGQVAVQQGAVMAACDTFHVTINGTGGHGSTPHLTVDPIVVGASLVQNLQTIVSRSQDPMDTVVVTVGAFLGVSQQVCTCHCYSVLLVLPVERPVRSNTYITTLYVHIAAPYQMQCTNTLT